MSHPSTSTLTPEQERPWLQAHYAAKRQRTVTLVKAAVDHLQQEGQKVTIEAICRVSRELDSNGKGVQKAGVLGNHEAHAYYREHSASYQTYRKRIARRSNRAPMTGQAQPARLDPDRDVDRTRRRYLQASKAELVERLLVVEQAYAQSQQQLARLQFALLEAQQAEAAARQRQPKPRRNQR